LSIKIAEQFKSEDVRFKSSKLDITGEGVSGVVLITTVTKIIISINIIPNKKPLFIIDSLYRSYLNFVF